MTTRTLLLAAALIPVSAVAQPPTAGGFTGLSTVPTADVRNQGSIALGYARFNPRPARFEGDADNYWLSLGFLPNLEIGGRLVETLDDANGVRDLSFNAKYRVDLPWGIGVAAGVTDVGGQASHFRSTYAVATVPFGSSWYSTSLTAGYGAGPDILDGAFGGLEWKPTPYTSLVVEHDAADVNAGIKLGTGALLGDWQIGANAFHHGDAGKVALGASVAYQAHDSPLRPSEYRGAREGADAPASDARGDAAVMALLRALGYESVRVGRRGSTQVVALENRTYNHSATDGISVALNAIAGRMSPELSSIELHLSAYDVPQVRVLARVGADRAPAVEKIEHSAGLDPADKDIWADGSEHGLRGTELVLEPVLRSFLGTEAGVVDYSLTLRPRVTWALNPGVLLNLAVQLPVADSDDYRSGGAFRGYASKSGLDTALIQYAHKPAAQWTSLWSAGVSSVLRSRLTTVGHEQVWMSRGGEHQFRSKLLVMQAPQATREVAVAGYAYFDPLHAYSVGLSLGKYYYGEGGGTLDVTRYFGDVICSVYFRGASRDDQLAGVSISFPLTPRRDSQPGGLQVKGPRRWAQSRTSTIAGADSRNLVRPLLAFEPTLDLDLRRDFYDAGRLAPAWQEQALKERAATP